MQVKHVPQFLAAVAVMSVVTGCSTTVFYNPALVAQRIQQVGVPSPGRALIYTTVAQDAYVYKGRPNTFAGSAVEARIPFGRMTHEIAIATFNDAFSQGTVSGRSLDRPSDFQVIIMPSVTEFDYQYSPTPGSLLQTSADIRMKLRGKVLSPDANVLMDKVYDSNRVMSEGTAGYVPKMLNKVVHTTLCDLMSEFARDVKLIVLQQFQAPPAAAYRSSRTPSQPAPAMKPTPVYTAPAPTAPMVDPSLVPELVPIPPPDGF